MIYKFHAEQLGELTLGIMGGYANAKGKTINHTSNKAARNTLDGYSVGYTVRGIRMGKMQQGSLLKPGCNITGLMHQ